MGFNRGNARGPAEKRAVSAIYFGNRGNHAIFSAVRFLTAEKSEQARG